MTCKHFTRLSFRLVSPPTIATPNNNLLINFLVFKEQRVWLARLSNNIFVAVHVRAQTRGYWLICLWVMKFLLTCWPWFMIHNYKYMCNNNIIIPGTVSSSLTVESLLLLSAWRSPVKNIFKDDFFYC